MSLIPCIHDYLDPNSTVVVSPGLKEAWCISCSKNRKLLPVSEPTRIAAVAARSGMLFGGGSRGNN